MQVRDWGPLVAALVRPQTTVFGEDAYPTLWDQAAALMHSRGRNHALVDGNKRVRFTAAASLPYQNGVTLTFGEDEAYDLVIAVAEGLLDVPDIAVAWERWVDSADGGTSGLVISCVGSLAAWRPRTTSRTAWCSAWTTDCGR